MNTAEQLYNCFPSSARKILHKSCRVRAQFNSSLLGSVEKIIFSGNKSWHLNSNRSSDLEIEALDFPEHLA